ncbi:MAG: response regulator [Clostridiaceae bacterium]
METIKVFIADGKPETNIHVRNYFSKSPRLEIIGECSDGALAVKMCIEKKPDIVLLDMDLPGVGGIGVAEVLTAVVPNVLVIMTCSKLGKESFKKAMAAGARDLIEKPFIAHELVHKVISLYDNRARSLASAEEKNFAELAVKHEVITVFSTKGGVGKTTVASNIAAALAEKTNEKVALLDFDLEFGDVPIMFNIYPDRTIHDLNNEIQNLDADLLEEYLIEHPSGVKILSAPLSPEFAGFISPKNISRIINVLLENYKYIIIDTAPSFHDINLAAMDVSDKIFYVTTLDLPSIKNAKLGLQVMKTLKYDDNKINLVLNRYNKKFGITKKDIEKSIGKKTMYTIPEDTATVVHSMNKGNPFVISHNSSGVAKSVIEISGTIAADKKVSEKSLLRKLFG